MRRVLRAFSDFRLFRDYAVLASGQIGAKILGFVAFAYLARVLDPESYGGLEYVVGLSVFFAALVEGGLGVIAVRRVGQDPTALPTLTFQILVARFMTAVVAIPLMALLVAGAMGSHAPPALVWLFALSLLTVPLRQDWLMQATERMTENAVSQIIRAVVFAAVVWAAVKSAGDVVLAGWAEIASVVAMTAYCVYVQQRWITPVRLKGSMAGFWGLIWEGVAVSSTHIAWQLMQTLPLIMLGWWLGGLEVALFAAAARLIGSIMTFSNLYHFNLFPTVARASASDRAVMAGLLRSSFRVTAWGGSFVALALTLFADETVRIVFGPKLTAAAPLVAVMAWTLPIALCSGHVRWGLTAIGEQKKVFYAHAVGVAAIAALCPLLGHFLGVLGYAWGAAAGPVAIWLVAHAFAARAGNQPPPFHIAARPALLAGALVAAAFQFEFGWLLKAAAVAAFAAASLLLDAKLIGALGHLGRAKAKGPPE